MVIRKDTEVLDNHNFSSPGTISTFLNYHNLGDGGVGGCASFTRGNSWSASTRKLDCEDGSKCRAGCTSDVSTGEVLLVAAICKTSEHCYAIELLVICDDILIEKLIVTHRIKKQEPFRKTKRKATVSFVMLVRSH
jgi:hypothetical protein